MTDLCTTFDLACPHCGQADVLDIDVNSMCHVTVEGCEPYGDENWNPETYVACPECEGEGTIISFTFSSHRRRPSAEVDDTAPSCKRQGCP